jgi:glycosyltransferase involved in cell wall biosynthesis
VRIALVGSRGIPCTYGGFETFAERLSVGLIGKGHDVIVYGHLDSLSKKQEQDFKGIHCINLAAPSIRAFQKPVLSFKATFHSLKKKPDIVFFLGVSAAPFAFISRLAGAKTVVNLDGVEWKRGKWGRLGRLYLKLSERIAAKTCRAVVADSLALVDIYRQLYSVDSVFIPYGADVAESVPDDALRDFGLEARGYILQSCRLEPENNVHLVIEGYLKSKKVFPLVILGDAPLGDAYKARLMNLADSRVRFLGSVYGPAYKQIVAHSALYIHAHEVGGTNPSLLEAMAAGIAPLYLDVPFNREVVGEVGFPFVKDASSLSTLIDEMTRLLEEVESRSIRAKEIIRERYSWESVVDSYEKLFFELTGEK